MNGYKPKELGATGVILGAGMSSLSSSVSESKSGGGSSASNASASTGTGKNIAKTFSSLVSATFDAAKKAVKELTVTNVVGSLVDLIKGDLASNPTIKLGAKGAKVVELQQALNSIIGAALNPDGVFGPKTDAAVRSFQISRSLVADGIVGPKTWSAVQSAQTKPTTPQTQTPQVTSISQSSHADEIIATGDKNAQVAAFQAGINNMGYASTGAAALIVDGVFGALTAASVAWAQKSLGLPVTGKVDAATYKAVTAVKSAGQNQNQITEQAEKILSSANPTVGVISEANASVLISADSRVLSRSRYANVARSRSDSAMLVEAVLAQMKPLVTKKIFNFFDALNAYLLPIVEALAWHESQINNAAVGGSKEISAFQLLPSTVTALSKKYSLPALNISSAASLAGYLTAMFKDMDSFAGTFIKKDISGAMIAGTPGNEHITSVLSQLNTAPTLMTQLFTFFMLYNAGLSETTWLQEWRSAEAYKRTLSVIVTAGGY